MKYLILLLLVPNLAFGNCDIPTQIKEKQASPCDGYVISPETELKIRTDLIYKDALINNLEKTSELQKSLNAMNEKQMLLYKQQLDSERTTSNWEKLMYFGLGSLATSLAISGAMQLVK